MNTRVAAGHHDLCPRQCLFQHPDGLWILRIAAVHHRETRREVRSSFTRKYSSSRDSGKHSKFKGKGCIAVSGYISTYLNGKDHQKRPRSSSRESLPRQKVIRCRPRGWRWRGETTTINIDVHQDSQELRMDCTRRPACPFANRCSEQRKPTCYGGFNSVQAKEPCQLSRVTPFLGHRRDHQDKLG